MGLHFGQKPSKFEGKQLRYKKDWHFSKKFFESSGQKVFKTSRQNYPAPRNLLILRFHACQVKWTFFFFKTFITKFRFQSNNFGQNLSKCDGNKLNTAISITSSIAKKKNRHF